MAEKRKKICFAASSGGHLEEVLLLSPLMDRYSSFILTEKTRYSADIPGRQVYRLRQCSRRDVLLLPEMIWNALVSLYVFIRERPDAVITTGVLAVIPFCLVMKLFGKKLIFIESFAKITSPTRTGRFLHRFADRFYVQWEPMLEFYPDAVWLGGLY